MQTVVQKWGNSLGIRIPSIYAKELALKNGSFVEISEEDGRIVISPKRISLQDLLSQVSTENIHEPVETGSSIGNEAW